MNEKWVVIPSSKTRSYSADPEQIYAGYKKYFHTVNNPTQAGLSYIEKIKATLTGPNKDFLRRRLP